MRARPIALVVMLITFAWVGLPFLAAPDSASRPDLATDAPLLQRSEATPTFVVGDRVTKTAWDGSPITIGILAVGALALLTLRRLAAAQLVSVATSRPSPVSTFPERGPPAF